MTREENIRAILDTCFSESKDEIKEVALKSIMSLSAEVVQGWIPTVERLPEPEEEVLMSDGKHVTITCMLDEWTENGTAYYWDSWEDEWENTAWMHLPEPYRREENEE